MGVVSVDIYKKDREYKNFTLSDKNVVKFLILNRSKLDVTHGANTNINIKEAGDTFEFNQEMVAMYASLDKTVEKSKLTKKQLILIELIYSGHSINDASKILNLELSAKGAYRMLDRIVDKIVSENNEMWFYTTAKNGFIFK